MTAANFATVSNPREHGHLCMVRCQLQCVLVVLQGLCPSAPLTGQHPKVVVHTGVGRADGQGLPVQCLTLFQAAWQIRQVRGKKAGWEISTQPPDDVGAGSSVRQSGGERVGVICAGTHKSWDSKEWVEGAGWANGQGSTVPWLILFQEAWRFRATGTGWESAAGQCGVSQKS